MAFGWQLLKLVLTFNLVLAEDSQTQDGLDISKSQATLLQLTKNLQANENSSAVSDALRPVRPWQLEHGLTPIGILSISSALKESFKSKLAQPSCPSGSICMPAWFVFCLLIGLAVCAFYLVNYVLWTRRRILERANNIDSSREHSEHGNFLGRLVEEAIEHFDKEIVGVDINFGSMDVNPRLGTVEVGNLTIHNPEGYWSEHFLHVESCLVDIDMQAYVTSFGKQIIIEELVFKDVSVIWERGFSMSNMMQIMNFLQKEGKAKPPKEQPKTKKEKPVLKKVHIEAVSMKMASWALAGCGATLVGADLIFDNFSEEMKDGTLEFLPLLVTTLIKSFLANIIGAEGAERILNGTSGILEAIYEGLSHLVMMIVYGISGVFCCARRPEKAKSAPKKDALKPKKVEEKTGCGSSSSCMPCQALLESRR